MLRPLPPNQEIVRMTREKKERRKRKPHKKKPHTTNVFFSHWLHVFVLLFLNDSCYLCVCVRPMTSHGQSTHTHTCGDRWGFYILFLSLLHPLDGLPCTMARHRRRPSTDFCGWYVWWGEENYDKVTTTTTTTTTTTAVCVCVCASHKSPEQGLNLSRS